MALENVRLLAVYNGFQFGSNGINHGISGASRNYYIDASRRAIVMERANGKFRFACDVVVSETPQSEFVSKCQALEDALDSSQRNGNLFLASESSIYQNLSKATISYVQILNYTAIASGTRVSITPNGGTTLSFFANTGFGTHYTVGTSNRATAISLANAINGASSSSDYVTAIVVDTGTSVFVHLQPKRATYSLVVTTTSSASGLVVTPGDATGAQTTGFNARTSISKVGSEDDTALSRRYEVEITVDLPHKESGRGGLRDSRLEITETDSRQKMARISGTYTALFVSGTGARSALEQYTADCDTHSDALLANLGGTWEGPFDVRADLNDDYPFPTTGANLGTVLNFSRTYQELIYTRSLSNDVRLRRALLTVRVTTPAPGDYGPGAKPVFRMRNVVVEYSAAVNKVSTQDLKGVYRSVVKPFLESEARGQLDGEQVALISEEPTLDKTKNRISARMEYLAAQGDLVESTVTTTDEDDDGKQLVAVWDGDDYSKEEYQGPKTLRRTVVQSYTILSTPASAKGGQAADKPASAGFGIFALNTPLSFQFSAPNATEANIDNFFFGGIATGKTLSVKGGADDFPTSGGVPEPKGFVRVFRNGSVSIKPVDFGRPGGPQIKAVVVVKTKVFEYIHKPKPPTPTTPRSPSPGAGGGGSSDTPGMTVAKDGAGPKARNSIFNKSGG